MKEDEQTLEVVERMKNIPERIKNIVISFYYRKCLKQFINPYLNWRMQVSESRNLNRYEIEELQAKQEHADRVQGGCISILTEEGAILPDDFEESYPFCFTNSNPLRI